MTILFWYVFRVHERSDTHKVITLYERQFWNLSAQVKNPQSLPNPYDTWGKYSPHEVIIFPKFHKNWAKIVGFLLWHSDFKIAFPIKLRLYIHTPTNTSENVLKLKHFWATRNQRKYFFRPRKCFWAFQRWNGSFLGCF